MAVLKWFFPSVCHQVMFKFNIINFNIKVNQVLGNIQDKSIVFEWVPSHINILGNELADKAAKKATE